MSNPNAVPDPISSTAREQIDKIIIFSCGSIADEILNLGSTYEYVKSKLNDIGEDLKETIGKAATSYALQLLTKERKHKLGTDFEPSFPSADKTMPRAATQILHGLVIGALIAKRAILDETVFSDFSQRMANSIEAQHKVRPLPGFNIRSYLDSTVPFDWGEHLKTNSSQALNQIQFAAPEILGEVIEFDRQPQNHGAYAYAVSYMLGAAITTLTENAIRLSHPLSTGEIIDAGQEMQMVSNTNEIYFDDFFPGGSTT
jgi:hypothetical protein